MNKEIKYCLIGAILTFIISAILGYFDIIPMVALLVKVVYMAFTICLVFFVIRLLATAEIQKGN
jgi:heme A synthase